MTQDSTHYAFEAEVSQVLSLVINSLYSNKEIFIRELVSNASDAIDKARFAALSNKDLLGDDTAFHIRLIPDAAAGTLTILDNGIGMTKEELVQNLGTIAHSGSRNFLESLQEAIKESQEAINLIGQFGVGFYSSFLVADKVEVVTKPAGATAAWRWISQAKDGYTIEEATKDGRGTAVILHLKEDQKEYLEPWRLKTLVSRYADYVSHAIEMPAPPPQDQEDDEEVSDAVTFEQVNQASALWRRSPDDIDEAQYNAFYKHLTHDWQDPLMKTHFHVEGTREFTGLLFIPGQPPFDMFTPDAKRGVRLYVKRVFIMEDYEEVVPQWLRFVRGVIDSDDLPLNVSRELLQDSGTVRVIQKQVVKKALQMLEQSAADDANKEQYITFWEMFGRVLKEGLHYAPTHVKTLGKLMRYHSSTQPGWTSLTAYIERMKDGQEAIYYAIGQSQALLENSPHLEALKTRGYEVLYMADPVDEWAMQTLREFEDKPLVSALSESLDLGDSDDEPSKEEKAAEQQKFSSLTDRFNHVLAGHIQEVRLSERLEDSPVCLVIPEGGLHAHTERMLRAQDQNMPRTKRILEVNPKHSLIQHLQHLESNEDKSSQVAEWIELLYDQALLTEGSPIENPAAFARRVTHLMEQAASQSEATT